jgi:hypothetical protein
LKNVRAFSERSSESGGRLPQTRSRSLRFLERPQDLAKSITVPRSARLDPKDAQEQPRLSGFELGDLFGPDTHDRPPEQLDPHARHAS